jgi:hypothetical protein
LSWLFSAKNEESYQTAFFILTFIAPAIYSSIFSATVQQLSQSNPFNTHQEQQS